LGEREHAGAVLKNSREDSVPALLSDRQRRRGGAGLDGAVAVELVDSLARAIEVEGRAAVDGQIGEVRQGAAAAHGERSAAADGQAERGGGHGVVPVRSEGVAARAQVQVQVLGRRVTELSATEGDRSDRELDAVITTGA